MDLSSKQRAQLRKLANGIPAIFQIGKAGITEELIEQLSFALEARELVKITVLETVPINVREVADALTLPLRAEVVQCIGRKVTLYRKSHTAKTPLL